MKHVLAIDQGTTSTRAILFDERARAVALARRELPQHYPASGWVEHDPEDIWRDTLATVRRGHRPRPGAAAGITALGITNQRETVVVWERASGQPDPPRHRLAGSPHAPRCARARRAGAEEVVRRKTGTAARSLLLRHQDRLDSRPRARRPHARRARRARLRHRRHLPALAADRRGACTSPTSPTPRAPCSTTSTPRTGTRSCCACCASRASLLPQVRDSSEVYGAHDARALRPVAPHRRDRRRPAGRAHRAGVLRARHGQVHLRHRLLPAAQHRRDGGRLPATACSRRPPIASAAASPTPWRDRSSSPARRSSGCATASRSSAAPPRPPPSPRAYRMTTGCTSCRRSSVSAPRTGSPHARGLICGLTLRCHRRAPGARRARVGRLSDSRPHRCHAARRRAPCGCHPHRRRHGGERLVLPVPGRRARGARRAARASSRPPRSARHSSQVWPPACGPISMPLAGTLAGRGRLHPADGSKRRERLVAGWRHAVARTLLAPGS